MPLQMCVSSEELATGGALKRFLSKVDGIVVSLHVDFLAKDLAARRVTAWKLLAQMRLTIVCQHLTIAGKWFAASRAWELASQKLLLVAKIQRWP